MFCIVISTSLTNVFLYYRFVFCIVRISHEDQFLITSGLSNLPKVALHNWIKGRDTFYENKFSLILILCLCFIIYKLKSKVYLLLKYIYFRFLARPFPLFVEVTGVDVAGISIKISSISILDNWLRLYKCSEALQWEHLPVDTNSSGMLHSSAIAWP